MYFTTKQELCHFLAESFRAHDCNLDAENLAHFMWASVKFKEFNQSRDFATFENWLNRILNGEPIQYIVEEAVFHDLVLEVNANVLIPRPETEELAYRCFKNADILHFNHIMDIGTGSGCIAIYLKSKLPKATMKAIDVSNEALELANRNALKYKTKIEFEQLDFLTFFPNERSLEMIVSNPPYIGQHEMKLMSNEVLNFEPHLALFPNSTDIDIFYRRIAEYGQLSLVAGGQVLCEINEYRAEQIMSIFKSYEYQNVTLHRDLQDKNRIIEATK